MGDIDIDGKYAGRGKLQNAMVRQRNSLLRLQEGISTKIRNEISISTVLQKIACRNSIETHLSFLLI